MKTWLSRVSLVMIVLTVHLVGGQVVMTQRAIPDDNLAYPVLITLNNGNGSGFYLQTAEAIYLVTAKHVLFDPVTHNLRAPTADVLSYARNPSDLGRNFGKLDLSVLQSDGNIKPHPSEDVAVVKIGLLQADSSIGAKETRMELVRGVAFTELVKSGLVTAPLEFVKTFDQVLVGNDVILFGYPNSLGLEASPQLDSHHPLLRKGIVAGTNPAKRSIVLDCASYPGNSGGPVVELDRQALSTNIRIIGVVIEYVPFADAGRAQTFVILNNSGYSIATPMDFVLELVK